jgi:hypothetical protein
MLRLLSYIESIRLMAAIAAALFFLPTAGFGQIQSATNVSDPVAIAALPSEVMELRREGSEAMFNIDYTTAVAKFEEI